MASSPRLAPSSGNITQFLCATLPFLVLLIYLLYLAFQRPSIDIYSTDVDDDVTVRQVYAEADPIIPLLDMLGIFLSVEFLFALLSAYVFVFLPRRRRLLRSYFQQSDPCLGDVEVKAKAWRTICGGNGPAYGKVTYTYPDSNNWKIQKNVRVFQVYTREKVTILRLWNRPFSGHPCTDLDIDLKASMRSVHSSRIVGYVSMFWVLFCLGSQFYLLNQMSVVEEKDAYENTSLGWKLFIGLGLVGIPVLTVAGVFSRWAAYKHSMVHKGTVLKEGELRSEEDAGLVRVFWTEMMDSQKDLHVPGDDSSFTTNSVVDRSDASKQKTTVEEQA